MTKYIFDALTVLRSADEAAETATADEAGLALDLIPQHYANQANNDGAHHYTFKAVFHNIAFGGTAVPTSVSFVIDVDSVVGFSDSPVQIAEITLPGDSTVEHFEVCLSMDMIKVLDPDAAAIRCGIVVTGGTAPTVDYGCFLTKY